MFNQFYNQNLVLLTVAPHNRPRGVRHRLRFTIVSLTFAADAFAAAEAVQHADAIAAAADVVAAPAAADEGGIVALAATGGASEAPSRCENHTRFIQKTFVADRAGSVQSGIGGGGVSEAPS